MLLHVSEKNFSYRWLFFFFPFFFVCAKKRNWKYIKILLGMRRWGEGCLIAQNPGFELKYSAGGPLEPAGGSPACCQGWGREGLLLLGPGATAPVLQGLPIPTEMPTLLGSSPGPPALAGGRVRPFCSFVRHLCTFRAPFRNQGHAPPQKAPKHSCYVWC